MFKFHGDFEFSASFLDGAAGRMQPRDRDRFWRFPWQYFKNLVDKFLALILFY